MLISHKGHTDTIQVYSVTVMTHVKALQAGHSSQGTSEPITPGCNTNGRSTQPPRWSPADFVVTLYIRANAPILVVFGVRYTHDTLYLHPSCSVIYAVFAVN